MNINEMDLEQVETRMAEVKDMLHEDGADLDALENEINELKTRKASIMAEIETRKAEINEVIEEAKEIAPVEERSKKKMENIELRNTKEYINAYAEYIKTGSDKACRALFSANGSTYEAAVEDDASGVLPVPDLVDEIIHTAWERNEITSLVRKSYLKGNLQVGFEVSATDAVVHNEGDEAPAEEQLLLGTVRLVPASIKKWITITDEAMDMGGEEFLRYIYDELTYRIAKKLADDIVYNIAVSPATSNGTQPGVPVLEQTSISVATIGQALALLSDEAVDPVIVMNKKTWGAFKAVQYGANYAVDPFEGLKVVFNNAMPAYETLDGTGTITTFAIVGDFGRGYLCNFPKGDDITIKFDDLSLAESDLVKIVGREYVGHGVVAPNAFVKINKAASE